MPSNVQCKVCEILFPKPSTLFSEEVFLCADCIKRMSRTLYKQERAYGDSVMAEGVGFGAGCGFDKWAIDAHERCPQCWEKHL
jgi:hypothetical protein